jgi:hypothetical protein
MHLLQTCCDNVKNAKQKDNPAQPHTMDQEAADDSQDALDTQFLNHLFDHQPGPAESQPPAPLLSTQVHVGNKWSSQLNSQITDSFMQHASKSMINSQLWGTMESDLASQVGFIMENKFVVLRKFVGFFFA